MSLQKFKIRCAMNGMPQAISQAFAERHRSPEVWNFLTENGVSQNVGEWWDAALQVRVTTALLEALHNE